MIIGNGIDIIETDRIKKILKRQKSFINRIYSDKEKKYIKSRKENIHTIAGMFAAKEAVSKSLGSGIRDFKWKDIEILHDSFGKPYVELNGNAKKLAEEKGIENIHISITHIEKYALAFAICDNNKVINKHNQIKQEDKNKFFNLKPIDDRLVKSIIPERKNQSHKGTYGRVSVLAGCKGMLGASYLTSMASLRSGSGLVYTLVPNSLYEIMEIKATETIIKPVEDLNKGYFNSASFDEIQDVASIADVIALGPGLGVDEERIKLVNKLLASFNKPIVLDADGINCVSKMTQVLEKRKYPTIITPHPGELSRLLNISIQEIQDNRVKYARLTSKKYGVITVLKGANTIVASKEGEIFINMTGNPGMATAGSGDVLTGVISSFIGQGIEPLKAAIAGVYIHGLAGDLASYEKGQYGIIATDILEKIPYSIKKLVGK
ncbi:NAD(P)H-hydrate dehydratase [Caldisalinibacter kiritimatiensis]|uniref:Multifunctional fusion protein n=1 Tax=Caldisalinibacter kiritimatiensis TaxID=1304284 RepID=R1CLH4_9FIRM|nr:NAD(P)H-hydrate dehydratase [Caldisalinibacter kiritimatiensis]EOC99530.1 YjeF protein, function unknown [Caldisalinibacter kiritimatiensis]